MTPAPAKRAWMVRGSNVDGYNLVPEWLREGFVSLSASQLGQLDPGCRYDELRQAVETGYQHKSYAYRGQRLEEFDRFLRRMRPGDLVLTPMHGERLSSARSPDLRDFAESSRGPPTSAATFGGTTRQIRSTAASCAPRCRPCCRARPTSST